MAMKLLCLRVIYTIAMRFGLITYLPAFIPLWAASNLIHIGPVGPSATIRPEARAWRRVVADLDIADQDLYRHLEHPSANVVGYCLEALLARRSLLLARLPPFLRERSESVSMGLTCLICDQPLSQYALNRIRNELQLEPEFRHDA